MKHLDYKYTLLQTIDLYGYTEEELLNKMGLTKAEFEAFNDYEGEVNLEYLNKLYRVSAVLGIPAFAMQHTFDLPECCCSIHTLNYRLEHHDVLSIMQTFRDGHLVSYEGNLKFVNTFNEVQDLDFEIVQNIVKLLVSTNNINYLHYVPNVYKYLGIHSFEDIKAYGNNLCNYLLCNKATTDAFKLPDSVKGYRLPMYLEDLLDTLPRDEQVKCLGHISTFFSEVIEHSKASSEPTTKILELYDSVVDFLDTYATH